MTVFIDGENFRHGLKRVFYGSYLPDEIESILLSYKLRDLLEDVLSENNLRINYYAAKIKPPKGYEISQEISNQIETIREFTRKWVTNLQKNQIKYVKGGYLKLKSTKPCPKCGHIHDVLQEKGVDVKMAIDLVANVRKGRILYVFSSDTDLAPALLLAKEKQAKIVYITFADSVNRAIAAIADETVSISVKKITQYGVRNGKA